MKDLPFDPYDFFGYLAAGLVVLVGLEFVVGVPRIVGRDLKPLDLTAVVLAAYVAGQLAATPAKALLEALIANRILGSPSENLMRGTARLWWQRLFPGYYKPLPASVQDRIRAKAIAEGLTEVSGEDLFLHIRYRDCMRADAVLMDRLQSFLNKYGFSRNLCFVTLLFAAVLLAKGPFSLSSEVTKYALIGAAASILLFYRYLKFFRQYTYELFNAYAGKP